MGNVEPGLNAVIVLNILMLEDDDEDALLLERALRRTGYAYALKRARGRAEFLAQLEPSLDLILADYHLPDFDVLGALGGLKERGLDIPLILVSGLARDEEVLAAVRGGAADFVSKDRLPRLGAAIGAVLGQRALRQQAREVQQALERSREELDYAFEHAAIGIALTTLGGRWLRVNRALARITGYDESELLGADCRRLLHPEDAARDADVLGRLVTGEVETVQCEQRYLHKLGHVVWVQVTAFLVRDREGRPRHGMLQILDVTQRREVEERLARANRARQVLLECNQAQARASSEDELLRRICGIVVNSGGYSHAWIGLAVDDEDRSIRVAGEAGYPTGYLESIPRTWAADGRRAGVMGQVIATGRPHLSQNILAEDAAGGRHPRALELGYQSSFTLPLVLGGRAVGGLSIYAREPDAFDADEVALLEALAKEISHGIGSLRAEAARRCAEARLKRLVRARRVMGECNHIQVHATDETRMLEDMCRIAVESGGYRQAWIGLATGDSVRPLYPAAHAGYGADAPMSSASTWSADGRYQGLAGEALASGETRIQRDILNDSRHARQRQRAVDLGYQCSIALPLRGEGRVLGVLVLHAAERDAFDGEEIALLGELADDIGFGVAALRTRIAHRETLAALRESEERFRTLTELSSDWVWEQDEHFRFTHVSRVVPAHGGIAPSSHLGKTRWELPRTDPVGTTWEEHRAVLEAHRPFRDLLIRRTSRSGEIYYNLISGKPLFDAVGRFRGYRGVGRDITGQVRAELALRQSEQRFREIFEQAAVGITRVDLDGYLVDANEKFCAMLGYGRDEILGRHVREFTHPEDCGQGQASREQIAGGRACSLTGEKRFLRRDGTVMWARRTMSAALDEAGRPQYVISVVEDISERKSAEERYRATFENAPVGIIESGLDRRILRVNRKACEMLGYSEAELIGMNVQQVFHPDARGTDEPDFLDRMLAGETQSYSAERQFVRKDGTPIWVHRTVSLVRDAAGEPLYFIRVVEDITERRRAERELERKTALAQLLERLARATSEAASPEAAMRVCLEEISRYGGWSVGRLGIHRPGETGPLPATSLWHPQQPAGFEPLVRASTDPGAYPAGGRFLGVVLREKGPIWLADLSKVPSTGRLRVAERCGLRSAFAFPVIVDGEVAAFLEFFATELRQPDSLLLEAAASVGAQLARLVERSRAMAATAQLAAIVESSQDAMISIAPDGTILTWNAGAESLFGYPAAEAVGRDIGMLVSGELRHEALALRAKIVAGEAVRSVESERLARSGRRVQVSVNASVIRDGAGNVSAIALTYRDITERKRAEEAVANERALLRTIIDTLPDYVFVKDREGRFVLGNEAWLRVRGMTSEAIAGKTVFDVFPREIAEKMAAQDAAIVRGGPPLLDEEQMVVMKSPDGRRSEMRWSATTKVPMRDASGRIVGTVGISRDITERRLSARRRAMQHAVTRALAESATVEEAIPRVLHTMAQAMGWAYGARWSWSEQQETLVRCEHWSDAPVDFSGPDDVAWLRLRSLESGGLLRRAWAEKATTWIEDIEREGTFNRRRRALELGFRSAYSFPILADGEVIGVIEFFARDVRRPDEGVLQITHSIGSEIGQFIQRRQAEEALRTSEERYRDLFEASPLPMWIWDDETLRFLTVNQAAVGHYGYSREELLRMTVRDIWAPDGDGADYEESIRGRAQEQTLKLQRRHRTRDGRVIDVEVTARRFAHGGRPVWLTLLNDVTDRRRAEAALRESEEQFRQLANNIPQVFWISDAAQRRTLYLSLAAEKVIGRPLAQLMSDRRALIRVVHLEDRARLHAARRNAALGGYDETYRIVRPDGTIRWVHDRAFPVHDAEGRVHRIAGIAEDVTERKFAEERLMQLAHYDVLTNLPNRVLFYDRLRQAIAQAKRTGRSVGVMFLDVDRFKNVNDTLGHAVGDRMLQQISERLAGAVRSGDTVGRLGGDEFAIVLTGLANPQDANFVAQKVMAGFNDPFRLEGAEIYVTASIGITLYPEDSTDQDTLIRNADTAMYRAKEVGRNSYQFYTPEMNARALEMLGLESSLRQALARNELLLHYQPKARVADGGLVGFEALLRWRHPERGMVSPAQFMPVLEETGLIVPVGEWVLNTVCTQIKSWQAAGVTPLPVAVNLSARQFTSRDLGLNIKRILERHAVDPALIELELTESAIMINPDEATRTLEFLSSLGVALSIDDFGTGYSSLAYLKRFPLDALKVDRSFIHDITSDADDATITRAVISMAHSLGLRVIAEGVETAAQLRFLSEHGCDQIQGYYLARPLPVEECTAWLREGRRMEHRPPAPDPQAPVILLVDDEEDALILVKRALEREGYRILTARSAHEAFECLAREAVDVVIADQFMPGMSGSEFLRQVKTLHPSAVRMMTSAYTDFAVVSEAINKGEVFRFLPKGLTAEQLRSDVRDAVRVHAPARGGHPV